MLWRCHCSGLTVAAAGVNFQSPARDHQRPSLDAPDRPAARNDPGPAPPTPPATRSRTRVQGAPRGIERVALAAVVPTGGLLDAAAALVQSIAGQAHDVERVHHRDRVGQFLAVAVLNPVNPSLATTSTPSLQGVSRSPSQVLNTCFDRPSTISSSEPRSGRTKVGGMSRPSASEA
jgi:hypothetical protein